MITFKASKSTQSKDTAQRILITSALPYVNNVPHLGNLIGCVLSADVFARYCRSKGYETLYVCGTDEHGTATETKALEEGLTPKQVCDKYYKVHKQIYEWFGCSFDTFGRTSTDTHTKITQEIFLDLHKNGFVKQKTVDQLFCKGCSKFLADRFVNGTCPHCDYERARGDQCESCGKLLNAVELKKPTCSVCNKTPEVQTSEHLFLDLPKLSKKLDTWSQKQGKDGFWTQNAITLTQAWIKEGLKDRCITRDLKWGVPVPLKGFEEKVFYVWFDAPIGYPSITAHAFKNWKDWWQPKEKGSVKLYQFMAKDNIPFHTILFPGSLIGTGKKWNLLHHINSTEYLNYEDGKFSKSAGTGVFGDNAIDTGIPADVWRYYLLANRPETADTKFNWDDFREKNNHELLANLGNFVNRALVFLDKHFGGEVPDAQLTEEDQAFINKVDGEIDKLTQFCEGVRIKESLKQVMHVSQLCNQYFQKQEPWALVKQGDKTRCGTVLNVCVNQVRSLAVIAEPFLPNTAREIFKQLNLDPKDGFEWDSALKQPLEKGHKIAKPSALFRKLEEKEVQGFREKFKGQKKEATKNISFVVTGKAVDLGIKAAAAIVSVKKISNKNAELEKLKKQPGTGKLDDTGYVELHKKVGAEEDTSTRWLYELAQKNGTIPNINTFVDSYNLVSLKKGISAGAHDISEIKGNVRIDVCDGTEPYTELGQGAVTNVKKGEYAALDDKKIICRLELKQCNETKVTKEAKKILLYYQGHAGHKQKEVTAALLDACKLITEMCGGSYEIIYPASGDPFSDLDLRVAKITEVVKHANADKLFVEQIDLGSLGKTQIVSGLANDYKPEELIGKKVIVVCNLKPAKLRGEMSNGMLLAGEGKVDGIKKLCVLEAPDSQPGDTVFLEGGEASKPKKEITFEEFLKVKMNVKDGKALYNGKALITKKGAVQVDLSSGTVG